MSQRRDPPRVIVPSVDPAEVPLPEAQRHYLTHVHRLGEGAPVLLLDGRGTTADATLHITSPDVLVARVHARRVAAQPGVELTLGVAVPKGDRADWLVEKLTELGAQRLLWINYTRSVVTPKTAGNKAQRWQRIVASSAAQSRRATLMNIDGPMTLTEVLCEPHDHLLVADAAGGPMGPLVPGRYLALVGPEGGLTTEELEMMHAAGARSVRLASSVLRLETAAVALAAVVASCASDV